MAIPLQEGEEEDDDEEGEASSSESEGERQQGAGRQAEGGTGRLNAAGRPARAAALRRKLPAEAPEDHPRTPGAAKRKRQQQMQREAAAAAAAEEAAQAAARAAEAAAERRGEGSAVKRQKTISEWLLLFPAFCCFLLLSSARLGSPAGQHAVQRTSCSCAAAVPWALAYAHPASSPPATRPLCHHPSISAPSLPRSLPASARLHAVQPMRQLPEPAAQAALRAGAAPPAGAAAPAGGCWLWVLVLVRACLLVHARVSPGPATGHRRNPVLLLAGRMLRRLLALAVPAGHRVLLTVGCWPGVKKRSLCVTRP